MWKPFLLCVLGICFCEVSGQDNTDNSTQMYYFKLTVEEAAIPNVTEQLLNRDYTIKNYVLNNLTRTTECDLESKTCSCADGFEWSDVECSSPQCCGADTCSCISQNRVSFNGTLKLGSEHHGCLDNENTVNFQYCNNNLTHTIKTLYSRIYGFHSLIITKYRVGSVIANYKVVVEFSVKPSLLQQLSRALAQELNATLDLQTAGVVRLEAPANKVPSDSNVTLNCSSSTDLGSTPHWDLRNYWDQTKPIYDGTQSNIESEALTSRLHLKCASKLWTGMYTCLFVQHEENLIIRHSASAYIDMCVLPTITTYTSPGFPRCTQEDTELSLVIVHCEVEETYEEYEVTWVKRDIDAQLIEQPTRTEAGTTIYSAQTFVSCVDEKPTVTCKLKNRCGQEVEKTAEIITIKVSDKFCGSEGDWGDTKAGRTAVLKCTDSVGIRTRPCSFDNVWGKETSKCVNLELQRVLTDAQTCNIGQGKLEANADGVFTHLQNVTNNTRVINSVANLETSVTVINTMSKKLRHLDNTTTVENFLKSSSNMLDKSLQNSWAETDERDTKESLGETYLTSVEDLIEKANVTTLRNKEKNLEVVSCAEEEHCLNVVFSNNTVTMDRGGAVSIKTAGFQELERYLPNPEDDFTPNSIVISTTMQSHQPKTGAEGVKIEINFQLTKPRPRNTRIKCVYWDRRSHEWSERGCVLKDKGSTEKGVCECNHLSAFAILMSKAPLQVPYLSEITYAGLGVSIVFLIICLAIDLIIWSDVVKTDTLHLRHCAQVNISICLLVGDVCFLASSQPDKLSDIWCKTFVVVKHFCYLSMFFWMLCLSSILLHKTVYLSLHGIGKTAYLRFSVIVGYVSPLLIVAITFLTNGGQEGRYYSKETCWLVYSGTFKGSIFTFILPVGIIVFVNVFFMCLVIVKLLQPIKTKQALPDKEKNSAKTVIRSVILLTPVFGLTWGLGFLMILVDLTHGPVAYAVNYIFTIMNAFQGLYMFLTTVMGDRMVRDGLRRYVLKKTSHVSTVSCSTSSVEQSSIRKKPAADSEQKDSF